DAGATWKRMSAVNPRPMYYSKPTIDPNNDRRVWLPNTYMIKSEDGGATYTEEPTSPTYDVGLKTDHHVLRVDPANSSHIYVVGDGGLHESFDMGKTYVRVNNIPVGQVYRIAVDNRDPYWVYAGLQDNHSWMGPSATRHWLGILNQDWIEVGFSDGIPMMGVTNRDIKLSRNDGDGISEISNFAESPIDPKILWVGTDDGNLQLTTDGGTTWTELSASIKGVKDGTFVGDIVASSAARGTAYVSFDAHRDGDFAPYILRTADFGKTWTPVVNGLPADDASIRGLAEYPGKP